MTPVALPELPPSRYAKTGDVKDHNTFDLIDVRAYALAERAAERERCAAICEGLADRNEQATADQRSREAPDEKEQLARLRHWSTVSTYNAGMKNCAAAIRNQP
jgi:hypothetical protein